MAYRDVSASMPTNFFTALLDPGLTWGGKAIGKPFAIPSLVGPGLTFYPGTGSKLGKVNLMHFDSGMLTDSTPGTTDTKDIDLKVILDVLGTSKAYVSLCALLVCNLSTTDGVDLVIGGSAASPATNPWTSPFAAMTTPGNGRLTVPSGYVSPVDGSAVPGILTLWAGNLTAFPVGASNKVLRLYTAAASLPWQIAIVGRDA